MADKYFVFGSISYMAVPVTIVSAFHNLIPTPTQTIAYLHLETMLSHYSISVTNSLDEISRCVFIIKPTSCTNFTNFSGMKLYMFQTVPLSIIRSLFTAHSTMELQFHPGPAGKVSTNLYDIYHC
jgi:hypothetical protein